MLSRIRVQKAIRSSRVDLNRPTVPSGSVPRSTVGHKNVYTHTKYKIQCTTVVIVIANPY